MSMHVRAQGRGRGRGGGDDALTADLAGLISPRNRASRGKWTRKTAGSGLFTPKCFLRSMSGARAARSSSCSAGGSNTIAAGNRRSCNDPSIKRAVVCTSSAKTDGCARSIMAMLSCCTASAASSVGLACAWACASARTS